MSYCNLPCFYLTMRNRIGNISSILLGNYNVSTELFQFYTKPEVASQCWEHLIHTLPTVNRSVSDLYFVEPSAGTGSFFELMPTKRRLGIDIHPKCENVIIQDFFKVTLLPYPPKDTVIIGNPPFGKRGKLAVAFFNHAALLADIVAFIVPVNFRKYIVHKKLSEDMRFISKLELQRDSFYLESDKSYSVNTEFQIWTRLESNHHDMRQNKPLPIRHQDFQLWQYNNTVAAQKVFQNSFDFAVPCQGWQDYTRKETDEKLCERNKQWILLKANNSDILVRLKQIDYERLARECGTAVPGFRKGDLVKTYSDQFDNRSQR